MRIDRRLLGWGSLLIIAGLIPLAVRAGAVPTGWVEGWLSLWPLLLVGAGLGLLLRGTPVQPVGGVVSVLTAGVMLGGMLATGFHGLPTFGACGSGAAGPSFVDQSGSMPDPGRMTVEFNCGSLTVAATDGANWVISGRAPTSRQPIVSVTSDGVSIRPPEDPGVDLSGKGSNWRIDVPRTPVVGLSLTLNAGEGDVDLSGAHLSSINATVNAGSLRLDASTAATSGSVNATVNAGSMDIGMPTGFEGANLTLNAGAMKFCVPAGTQLRVHWSGGLAGNNLGAAGLTEVISDQWVTPGAGNSTVDVRVSANAGAFTLVIGGSCGA
ncbi:MAG: hypothetical protein ABI598_07095 [Chloroflexota bacterium]